MRKKRKKSLIKSWITAFIIAYLFLAGLKLFIGEPYAISSSSMEKTILTGDIVWVNKVSVNPRLPVTPVAFSFYHPNKNYWGAVQLPYFRVGGQPQLQHNDIIAFNYPLEDNKPVDRKTVFIKRLSGLPGDTLEITKSNIIINSNALPLKGSPQFNYIVKTDNIDVLPGIIEKYNITEGGPIAGKGIFIYSLTPSIAEEMAQTGHIVSVNPVFAKRGKGEPFVFPENKPWNNDFYGPLVIPKAGDTVQLTTANLPVYEKIISIYEKNLLEVENSTIYINKKPPSYYIIKQNYYFVTGDNRHNSSDSRMWGFVPESHIIGRAGTILFSIDKGKGKFRWNRIFKKLN